jgi:hypothetical protein
MYPHNYPAQPSGPRVTLTSISEVREAANGNPYFVARFKAGVFGKPISRTFWGRKDDNDRTTWDRVSPAELKPLLGQDLGGEVHIVPVQIRPEEYLNESSGEIHVVTSRAVVKLGDETLEQATRRCGSILAAERAPAQEPVIPQMSDEALALSGDGLA